jgi:phage-related tail protein
LTSDPYQETFPLFKKPAAFLALSAIVVMGAAGVASASPSKAERSRTTPTAAQICKRATAESTHLVKDLTHATAELAAVQTRLDYATAHAAPAKAIAQLTKRVAEQTAKIAKIQKAADYVAGIVANNCPAPVAVAAA